MPHLCVSDLPFRRQEMLSIAKYKLGNFVLELGNTFTSNKNIVAKTMFTSAVPALTGMYLAQ